jgi:hypothetical protein
METLRAPAIGRAPELSSRCPALRDRQPPRLRRYWLIFLDNDKHFLDSHLWICGFGDRNQRVYSDPYFVTAGD